MQKIYNKLWYGYFKLFIILYGIFVRVLILLSPILKKRKKKYDLLLYPYSQKGSDGYSRRFEEFFPLLIEDNISFKIQDICTDEEYKNAFKGNKPSYYLFLLKVFRIRIKQTIQIRHSEKSFVQRNLFPFYYDQTIPILEKLASKICDEVVYDYWDSVWVHNEELNKRTVNFANTISVANKYLHSHYSKSHSNVKYFNIGINLSKYLPKTSYDKKTEDLRLFYTGSPGNVKEMLKEVGDFLVECSKHIKIKLILVSSENQSFQDLNIEHHLFDEGTFFKLLNSSDLGVYALDDSVITRGKMAMKILDYSGTGLPILATKYGVSPHLIDKQNVLFCQTKQDWVTNLTRYNDHEELREQFGRKVRSMAEEFHSLKPSYLEFKALFNSLLSGKVR